MIISSAIEKMVNFYEGNLYDIAHFIKVWAFWLVSHHHTYKNVDGLDYQILLEADFLVNAEESGYKYSAIASAKKYIFKTTTGIRLLETIYLRGENSL